MDAKTKAGVLAHVAYRRVDAIRRRVVEDIVLYGWEANGAVPSHEEITQRIDALWDIAKPSAEALQHQVAAKCAAAVAFHDRELEWANTEVDRSRAKEERYGRWAAGTVANARSEDQAGRIGADRSAAQELLTAAKAAGGDPNQAPSQGRQRVIPAEVAAAVDRYLGRKR